MRKPKIKTLQNKLTKLVHAKVFERDKNTCQKCGKVVSGQNRHPSHVIPKSHGNVLRWNIVNIKTLCFHCHINWWHKNPVEAGEWFKDKFSLRWEYLDCKKNEIVKFKREDYERMIEEAK